MKLYILRSESNIVCVSELLKTDKYWLIPLKDGIGYDIYGRDVFSLEIVEALPCKKADK